MTAFIADGQATTATVVANLTNPATWSETSTFTVPSGVTLAANTTCYLVIEGDEGELATTNSDGEDNAGLSGWSIANGRQKRSVATSGLGGTWNDSNNALQIAIEAELGYGVGAPHGPGLVTPYAGLTLSGGAHRALRTGVRWNTSQSATVSLEASREGQGSGEAPTNALMVRAEARW